MRSRIQKWGNSMALRIPKPFAREASLKPNAIVNISLEEGKIIISAAVKPKMKLGQLLAGVTPRNLHREVGTGNARGIEVW